MRQEKLRGICVCPTWFPGPTSRRGRRHWVPAQRDRYTPGKGCLSRADGPRLTPSPPGPTGHRATPAGGSRLGWSQCLPGGWWGMHQEGQSPVWMAHSLLAAPQGNSIRTGIFSLRGGRGRGTPCSSAAPGLTWRGVPWPLSAVGLRHQEGVCTALSLGGSWAGVTYCAGIASSSNRADQEIRKKSIPVPSP